MKTSILYPDGGTHPLAEAAPACFKDLALAEVLRRVPRELSDPVKRGLFYTPAENAETVAWRQAVMRELEPADAREKYARLSEKLLTWQRLLEAERQSARTDGFPRLSQGEMLQRTEEYVQTVRAMDRAFRKEPPAAPALARFAAGVAEYCASDAFTALENKVCALRASFDQVRYAMLLSSGTLKLRPYEGQEPCARRIEAVFARFSEETDTQAHRKPGEEVFDSRVEEAVLERLAELYPEKFAALDVFTANLGRFEEETVLAFARDLQFYLAWLAVTDPVKAKGLPLCCPVVTDEADDSFAARAFDLALALREDGGVVTNSFELTLPERVLVVTGPNQGGKTTFARAFGQLHFLASLGVTVPAGSAKVQLCRRVLTHFEREEDLSSGMGKLEDDLRRLKALTEAMMPRSAVIVNEIFSSTTLKDALLLGTRMMDTLAEAGVPACVVTFLDELASHGPEAVSMMSCVADDEEKTRSFRVVRKAADGLAFARQIASRHGLTAEQLERRLTR